LPLFADKQHKIDGASEREKTEKAALWRVKGWREGKGREGKGREGELNMSMGGRYSTRLGEAINTWISNTTTRSCDLLLWYDTGREKRQGLHFSTGSSSRAIEVRREQ
jgi:hypothetical protein